MTNDNEYDDGPPTLRAAQVEAVLSQRPVEFSTSPPARVATVTLSFWTRLKRWMGVQ